MKSIKWSITIFCCFLFFGCGEFLEEYTQDERTAKLTSDYREMVIYYSQLYSELNLFDFYSDDMELVQDGSLWGNDGTNSTAYGTKWYFTWQPDVWENKNAYPGDTDPYKVIYNQLLGINSCLDGIDGAEGPEVERKTIKAQALALRAFYYFNLVNIYGEPYNHNKKALGVPLKTSGSIVTTIKRATVEEVYNQIIKDLTQAITLFEKVEKTKDLFFNITSAQILLSRVYLYMEQWENAVATATAAIASGDGLTNLCEEPYAKYMMMSKQEQALAKVPEVFTWGLSSHSEVEWRYGRGLDAAFSFYWVSDELFDSYSEKDVRPLLWFPKRTILKVTSHSKDWFYRAIRLSEAYLNRAEANAQLNNTADAIKDLNALRYKRIVNYKEVSSVNNLLNEVREERRKELCMENHRWFDLRRYGMPAITKKFQDNADSDWMVYTLKEKDPAYTLPIPEYIIEENSAIEQNASRFLPERTPSGSVN